MPYIQCAHEVGDVVFTYDAESDSLQRGKVVGIRCFAKERLGAFKVTYILRSKDDALLQRAEKDVHYSEYGAFPPLPSDPEPIALDEVAQSAEVTE